MSTTTTGRLGNTVTSGAKAPCRVATTANITLSGTQTIDDVAVVAGDRVFVRKQTTGADNGIRMVAAGAWPREPDWNASADLLSGVLVPVGEGTLGKGVWQVTYTGDFVLDTTSPTFTLDEEFSSTDSITASTTQTQAGATLCTTERGRIGTCVNTSDSVRVRVALAGRSASIRNGGAQSAKLWPSSGDIIDAGAADAADTNLLAAGATRNYHCYTTGTWRTV